LKYVTLRSESREITIGNGARLQDLAQLRLALAQGFLGALALGDVGDRAGHPAPVFPSGPRTVWPRAWNQRYSPDFVRSR
jgi:hypothetical protein